MPEKMRIGLVILPPFAGTARRPLRGRADREALGSGRAQAPAPPAGPGPESDAGRGSHPLQGSREGHSRQRRLASMAAPRELLRDALPLVAGEALESTVIEARGRRIGGAYFGLVAGP